MKNNNIRLAILAALGSHNFNRDGEGDEDSGNSFSQADIDAAVQLAVDNASAGFKAKNGELLNEVKNLKSNAKQWEGLNVDEVNNMMSVFKNNEEAQLIKDGKFEDVIAQRLDKVTTEHNTILKELTDKKDGYKESSSKYKSLYQNKFIDDAMKDLAAKTKARPEALKNISRDARDIFSVDDNGEIVALDENGHNIKTKSGDLMTPERFMDELKATNPYYWPDSISGGHGGDGDSGPSDREALEQQLSDAANAGDMTTYNILRDKLENLS